MYDGQLPLFNKDKRWKDGRQRFVVPPHIFDPREFHVDAVATRQAREFVLQHHYAQSFVAARFCYGMHRKRDLVGVAALSIPMSQRVIPHYLDVTPSEGLELGRFCLLDEIGFNAESWFLRRVLRRLRADDTRLKGIVSFADPMERTDESGNIQKRAHFGTAYRSAAAKYVGRSSPRWLHVLPNGQTVTSRTLSKIRNDEQGRDYASALLVRSGISPRNPFEDGREWLDRVATDFGRIYHAGNLAFTFAL